MIGFDTNAARWKPLDNWQEDGIEKYFTSADNDALVSEILDEDERPPPRRGLG